MARKKVKLEYIENDTARRVTYKKRVKGVVKKTQELSVLCGVDACAIVYGPYDQAPVVWPSGEGEAKRILREYKRKPDIDQSQRRFNQHSFLKQSVSKAEERLGKLQRRNREMEMENLMLEILQGKKNVFEVPYSDLGDLLWVIQDKLRGMHHRIVVLEGGHALPAPPTPRNDDEILGEISGALPWEEAAEEGTTTTGSSGSGSSSSSSPSSESNNEVFE